jgi:hypothetical protein
VSTTSGYLVTLDSDIDPATAERFAELIASVRGVTSVEPIDGDPSVQVMTEQRTLARCRTAMLQAVRELR